MSRSLMRGLLLGVAVNGGIGPATMRNRIKGEHQDVCYVTGFVNDAEFGVAREPFGEACAEAAPKLARYKLGEHFTSRWIVP